MSEIKITLELVMERTKHLTLNETEKEGQQKAYLKKRLTGLIQKYQDQKIKTTELFNHLNELTTTFGQGVEKQTANEILSRIDVEADDDRLLALLRDHFGLEISTLRMIQSEFKQAIQTGKINRIDIMKSELSDNHGVAGTAVIPNIEIDPEWHQERNAITKRFQIQMEAEKKRLASQ